MDGAICRCKPSSNSGSQANRFAIELLAPASRVRPYLRVIADLEDVLKLAKVLDLSKEAAARRYAELHPKPTALVFTKDGLVRYIERKSPFPFIDLKPYDRVPSQPKPLDETGLSIHEEADPSDWLVLANGNSLVVQTLHQQNGYAMTLLAFEDADGESDE